MVGIEFAQRRVASVGPGTSGAVAILAGMGCLLAYPLAIAGVLPGSEQMPPGVPRSSHPLVVYLSLVIGPVLVTWGAFALRHQTFVPLTPSRALVALVPTVTGIVVGVGWFTYEWAGTTPVDPEGAPGLTFGLAEIIQMELTAVQFMALAAVSALFVGTVAATYGWQNALRSTILSIGFVAFGLFWGPQNLTSTGLVLVVLLSVVPFAVGYGATCPEQSESSSPNR